MCMRGLMPGNKNFGNNLKHLRESKNLTQERLAELIGVEYQTISRIETGLYFTSYDNLQKIAKVLDVNISDLFNFQNEKMTKQDLIKAITKILKTSNENDVEFFYKVLLEYKKR